MDYLNFENRKIMKKGKMFISASFFKYLFVLREDFCHCTKQDSIIIYLRQKESFWGYIYIHLWLAHRGWHLSTTLHTYAVYLYILITGSKGQTSIHETFGCLHEQIKNDFTYAKLYHGRSPYLFSSVLTPNKYFGGIWALANGGNYFIKNL